MRTVSFMTVAVISGALAACAGSEPAVQPGASVAARVNGGEITQVQLDAALGTGRRVDPQGHAAARVLDRIIDEELLQERALRAGLDRLPQVQRALEAARRKALAHAYVEWSAQSVYVNNRQEAKRFYRDNPALFERRRMYRLSEVALRVPPGGLQELRGETARGGSLDELKGWLQARRWPYQAATALRAAEEIPLDVLPALLDLQAGQMLLVTDAAEASVLQLLHSEPAPISEAHAIPVIERYLANRHRLEVLQAEVLRLRAQAKIEYVGKFALAANVPNQ